MPSELERFNERMQAFFAPLWPGEESALFRRVSRCVRSFSERRVCTRFRE